MSRKVDLTVLKLEREQQIKSLEELKDEAQQFLAGCLDFTDEALKQLNSIETMLFNGLQEFKDVNSKYKDGLARNEDPSLQQEVASSFTLIREVQRISAELNSTKEVIEKQQKRKEDALKNKEETDQMIAAQDKKIAAEKEIQEKKIAADREFKDKQLALEDRKVRIQEEETQRNLRLREDEQDRKFKLEESRMELAEKTGTVFPKFGDSSFGSHSSSREITAKLPKLDIQKFDGNKLKWAEFKDIFDSAVHQKENVSEVEKFRLLKGFLEGDAYNAIAGIATTSENYKKAYEMLAERFGNQRAIVDAHYSELYSLQKISNSLSDLRTLYDTVERNFRGLEALGIDCSSDAWVSLLRMKLPRKTMISLEEMRMNKGVADWSLDLMRELLKFYLTSREAAEVCSTKTELEKKDNSKSGQKSGNSKQSEHYRGGSASALVTKTGSDKRAKKQCAYCGKPHWSDRCWKYPDIASRKKQITPNCYICLQPGHRMKDCTDNAKCYFCKEAKVHHSSLCPERFSEKKPPNSKPSAGQATGSASGASVAVETRTIAAMQDAVLKRRKRVALQMAMTDVRKPGATNSLKVRILLDTASDHSYISTKLAQQLKLPKPKPEERDRLSLFTFGDNKARDKETYLAQVQIQLTDKSFMDIEVYVIDRVTGPIVRYPIADIPGLDSMLEEVRLSDTLAVEEEVTSIDFLIGNDYHGGIMTPGGFIFSSGLSLLPSKLGTIVSGPLPDLPREKIGQNSNLVGGSYMVTSCHAYAAREPADELLTFQTNINQKVPELQKLQHFSSPDKSLCGCENLEDLWALEMIGITEPADITDDEQALECFNRTVKFENGRFYVKWPWKVENPDLPTNRKLAFRRLLAVLKHLQEKPELGKKCAEIIQEQLKRGIIEAVDETTSDGPLKHYIAWHPVETPQKETTKVRLVYDASAKTKKGNLSLNECLFRGPPLLEDLCGLLIRFRLRKIGILADIEKAFLQVGLQLPDREVTRFFWLKDPSKPTTENNLQIYRFCRVPFGIITSPHLLAATINYHLKETGSDLAEEIRKNIYVDNVLIGAETTEESVEKYKEGKSIFNKASMNLREWISNDSEFMNQIPELDRAKGEFVKVLGIGWSLKDDTLHITGSEKISGTPSATKRLVLKEMQSIYDPLGFFSAATIRIKMLLQEIWKSKLGWDDELSGDLLSQWNEVKEDTKKVSDFPIRRYVGKNEATFDLLCFTDASKKAYSVLVYLRSWDSIEGKVEVNLIFAKTRVAPVKEITIPKLELLGTVIGTRALIFVKQQSRLPIRKMILWTDSTCFLDWMKSLKPQPVFIENQLRVIRAHAEEISFRFIPGEQNPADLATRGIKVSELVENTNWWNGPKWLTDPTDSWPDFQIPEINKKVLDAVEQKKEEEAPIYETSNVSSLVQGEGPAGRFEKLGLHPKNFSSLMKLLRVTALCLRLVNNFGKALENLKNSRAACSLSQSSLPAPVTSDELEEARIWWEKEIQKKNFPDILEQIRNGKNDNFMKQLGLKLDEKGLIRCYGRLENADIPETAVNPKLLPKKDPYTRLIILDRHFKVFHSGTDQTLAEVRKNYWIPHGRTTVKRVLRDCRICRKVEGGPYCSPAMPPLPTQRVMQSNPFCYTGVDYFGPIYVKDRSNNWQMEKRWVALFVCMATRAVHLELVEDMSAEQFINCLRRFIGRRGTPKELHSDNALQFKLAKKILDKGWQGCLADNPEIQSYLAREAISWHFIPELSPWMGGFYERLVGIVKRAMKKSIGKKFLTSEQLRTLLVEIEAIVNSRPMVYVGSELTKNRALTPAHFLMMQDNSGIPDFGTSEEEGDEDYLPSVSPAERLRRLWRHGQEQLNQFWKQWRDQYLLSLRERYQRDLKSHRIQSSFLPRVGDVVLIKEENLPRGCWKIGRIHKLTPSSDGEIRVAQVQLPSQKLMTRAIKNLFPLECPDSDLNNPECDNSVAKQITGNGASEQLRDLPGREAKKKAKEKIQAFFRPGECRDNCHEKKEEEELG